MGFWSDSTDFDTVCRRAAGRRAYNARRKFLAALRLADVARLLVKHGGVSAWGARARVARELGVSRSTISRDTQKLLDPSGPAGRPGHAQAR